MQINHHIKLFLFSSLCVLVQTQDERLIQEHSADLTLRKEAFLYDASCHNKTVVCDLDLPEHNGFKISDVDPSLCTHVLYRQAELDLTTLAINENPKEQHEDLYKEVAKLRNRNPNVQLLLSIGGGGTWSTTAKAYGAIAAEWGKRQEFTKSVLHLLEKHKFQGVDVSWRHLGMKSHGGTFKDVLNLPGLLKELRSSLRKDYMLTISLSAPHGEVFKGHHWDTLSEVVDHVHVDTFNNVGPWQGFAYHHATLHENLAGFTSLENIMLLYTHGIGGAKLVPVLASHAVAFHLVNQSQVAGLLEKSSGSYTSDYPSYREVCQNLTRQEGWTTYLDKTCQVPFAMRGRWWLSFDDLNSIQLKIDFALKMDLKGVAVASIYNDDYTGTSCGSETGAPVKYPLLRNINYRIAHILGSECPSNEALESSGYFLVLVGFGVAIFIIGLLIVGVIFIKSVHRHRNSTIEIVA